MSTKNDAVFGMFCTALEMKEKKKELYENGMKSCSDKIGVETFKMLRDAEEDHLKGMKALYEELQKGKVSVNACQFVSFGTDDKKAMLRKLAKEYGKLPKACIDDVAIIEKGMHLESATMEFFDQRLKEASDPAVREFLQRIIPEERGHYNLLADLKYYYTDTEGWFIEKDKAGLDGAGAGS